MECSCEIDVYDYDYEPVTNHSTKTQKARKQHKCSECTRLIPKGEEYKQDRYKFDGKWWTHKTCPDCLSLTDQFMPGIHIFCGVCDHITEHIRELDGEIPESCISALTPGARAFVCGEIECLWGDEEGFEEPWWW